MISANHNNIFNLNLNYDNKVSKKDKYEIIKKIIH